MIPQELVAPIAEDLRKEDMKFDIVKGIEHINYVDGKWAPGKDVAVEEGDWVTKTNVGYDIIAGGNGVANVYPVVTGNNRYDAIATGNVTIAHGGGFIYKTTKFVPGAYNVGANLTVKDLGAGEKVPSLAGANDAIVARVEEFDAAKGIMTISVLNR